MELRPDEGASEVQPLQQAVQLSTTAPEEAAKNIDRARLFDVSPDSYKGLKDQLDPQADAIERVPATVGPVTDQFARQSEQHTSLVKDDLSKMSFFEKRFTYLKNKLVEAPNLDDQIIELGNKEITDGKLSPEDSQMLTDLNQARMELHKQTEDIPDISSTEKVVTDIAAGVKDLGRSYWDNKGILATTVGSFAGAAALTGSIAAPATGGISVPAAATAGAVQGFITGSTVIGFVDGYSRMRGAMNNELMNMRDEKGAPINLEPQKRAKVAQGVALISGVLQAGAGKVLARSNPLAQRFVSAQMAAKLLSTNAATLARMEIIGGMVQSATAQGGAAAVTTLAQKIGTNFAKLDNSESSFDNILEATAQSMTAETAKEAAGSFGTGFGTGLVVSGAMGALGKKGLEKRFEQAQQWEKFKTAREAHWKRQADKFWEANPVKEDPALLGLTPEEFAKYNTTKNTQQERSKVLETQNTILEAAAELKETKLAKVAPTEMNTFVKGVFRQLGMGEKFWFTMDSLREFSNSPEKGAAIRAKIDPTGQMTKMAQELNTPIPLDKADVVELAINHPEITDHMRLDPNGESPVETRTAAQTHVEKLNQAEQKRAEILSTLGTDQPLSDEMKQQLFDLQNLAEDPNPYNDRNDYVESQSFTEIPGLMTKDEAEQFNTAHLGARLAVADSLYQDVDSKFATIENRIFKDVSDKDLQNDIKRLDTEFKVIERFTTLGDNSEAATAITGDHKRKGFSPSAIDPKTLPEDLKEIYLNDPVLKKRKAFVNGGMDLEESAVLNGVESGSELLRILAKTPSLNEIKNSREQRNIELRNRVNQTLKPTRLNERDLAFDNLTKIHIREMEHLRNKEWSTVKRGIVKIALPVPSVEELTSQAVDTVSKMKIRDLNPNQFKQGESKSQREAIKNFLNAEFEQAFENKRRAALNNVMRKETLKQQDKITSYQKFWKKVESPTVQQDLKDAGYLDAMNEFTEIYKLSGSIKNETERNSFNKWVAEQVEEGNLDVVIPERLDSTQLSFKDLTVEQYQVITEIGQNIVATAKMKNQLLYKSEQRKELKTMEMIQDEIGTHLKAHVDYDPAKIDAENKENPSFTEDIQNKIKTGLTAISSPKTVISELDNYNMGGVIHKYVGNPLKQSRTSKRMELFEISPDLENIAKTFYGNEFGKMFNTYVDIPEFRGISALGNGQLFRKTELLTLLAYMGDPEGRKSMKNFVTREGVALSPESILQILGRELTHKDAEFAQKFLVNTFKRFEERSFALHKKTTGNEPDMVKGVPYKLTAKDENGNMVTREYPGGYYPVKRKMMSIDRKAAKAQSQLEQKSAALFGVNESEKFARIRSSEMTQQGRLKERTGSERPLDLRFENFFGFLEEIVHDLHFREVGIDTLKILKNPINVENMQAVVGPKKYAALLNGVKDVISKTTERENTLHAQESGWVDTIFQKGHTLHAVMTIGLNLSSAMIQPESMSHLALRLGPKIIPHLSKSTLTIFQNINDLPDLVKELGKINPDLILEQDNVDNAVIKENFEWMGSTNTYFKKYANQSGQAIAKIRAIQKKSVDASFFMVRETDHVLKLVATHAVSNAFLSGDIEGFPIEKVKAMSEKERAETMQSVVQQAIDLTLTASAPEDKTALEKHKSARIFVRYWTDVRSKLNSYLSQLDKAKGYGKTKEYGKQVKTMMWLALVAGVTVAYQDAIRKKKDGILSQLEDDDTKGEMAKDLLWHFAISPVDQMIDSIPLVSSIKYAAEADNRSDYRQVSAPIIGVATDIATGIPVLKDTLRQMMKFKKSGVMSEVQKRALLNDAGYLLGGAPTKGLYKIINGVNNGEIKKSSSYLKDNILDLHKSIDAFVKAFKDEPDAEQFINDLKEYQKTLPTFDSDVKGLIPETAKDAIRISSGNDWKKVDPKTGAAGIYQFTDENWKRIAAVNPDLGLTENGRVSKDPAQQEKAMNWEIQDNTRGLMAYELPVNDANLLGAHKFGFDPFLAILQAKDDQKLTEVLKDKAKDPVFEDFSTVKSVKDYLNQEVKKISTNPED